jgi:hypothetical protein
MGFSTDLAVRNERLKIMYNVSLLLILYMKVFYIVYEHNITYIRIYRQTGDMPHVSL